MNEVRNGVLIIAHGSTNKSYTEAIRKAVDQSNLRIPKALGYLKIAAPDISTAMKDLEQQGVERMIIVPLLISSQANILEQLEIETKVTLTSALDAHPLIAEILGERLMAISQHPDQQICVLVGEGASTLDDQKKFEQEFAYLAAQIKAKFKLKDVRSSFLSIGNPTVREVVAQAQTDGQVIITPVILNKDASIDQFIFQSLKGLNYRYTGEALIPHPNLSLFIEWRVAETIFPPLKYKKGHETLSMGLNDFQKVAVAAGQSYPCSVLAFRVARIAFRSLWEDVPVVNDLEIISDLPPEAGSRSIFEHIADVNRVTYKGNWSEITPKSSSFIFTDRTRGKYITITTRESLFGGKDFFDLRNKLVNENGTLEEKRYLSNCFINILSNLLSKSDDEIFEWKFVSE